MPVLMSPTRVSTRNKVAGLKPGKKRRETAAATTNALPLLSCFVRLLSFFFEEYTRSSLDCPLSQQRPARQRRAGWWRRKRRFLGAPGGWPPGTPARRPVGRRAPPSLAAAAFHYVVSIARSGARQSRSPARASAPRISCTLQPRCRRAPFSLPCSPVWLAAATPPTPTLASPARAPPLRRSAATCARAKKRCPLWGHWKARKEEINCGAGRGPFTQSSNQKLQQQRRQSRRCCSSCCSGFGWNRSMYGIFYRPVFKI